RSNFSFCHKINLQVCVFILHQLGGLHRIRDRLYEIAVNVISGVYIYGVIAYQLQSVDGFRGIVPIQVCKNPSELRKELSGRCYFQLNSCNDIRINIGMTARPVFTVFNEIAGHESNIGIHAWKYTNHICSSTYFPV
ncbi:MAG: hypothetical protein H6Q69_3184, partial [Firmicutes bacterium]|nr:hypothetical protein [Bacillota bacterium]